jgi:hypothetical protein
MQRLWRALPSWLWLTCLAVGSCDIIVARNTALFASCFQIACFESNGITQWGGGPQLPTSCSTSDPISCGTGYSYNDLGQGNQCQDSNTATTDTSTCGVSEWDCTDNSTNGVYSCEGNSTCGNTENIARQFCANNGNPVPSSWAY